MHNRRKKGTKPLLFLLSGLLLFTLTACAPREAEPVSETRLLLNTVVTVTLYRGGDEELLQQCMEECARYEKIFSRTDPESELYALNAAGSMAVSEELLALLTTALDYCARSGGAFDITLGGVSDRYAFSSDSPRVPDEGELAEAMAHVGYEKVLVEGNTVTLTDPETVVDLGAIAKGYIADRLAELLRAGGVESATIDLGGNIYCVGGKADGSPFRVGIQCPFAQRSEIIGTAEVADKSVVTSGVYERCFEDNGVLYHHILDAGTGLPCQNGLLAVSIVSDRSVDGDALSTLCFALGLEEGLAFAEGMDGVEAIFLTEDGAIHTTAGAAALFRAIDP